MNGTAVILTWVEWSYILASFSSHSKRWSSKAHNTSVCICNQDNKDGSCVSWWVVSTYCVINQLVKYSSSRRKKIQTRVTYCGAVNTSV
jgi:hypothetical protein